MAAGSSSRLGQPKQLLQYKGKSLVRYMVEQCIKSEIGDVFVITGSSSDLVSAEISDLNVQCRYNSDWKEGMSTSIAFGVRHLVGRYDGFILVLVDQIELTSEYLGSFDLYQKEASASILISDYGMAKGPPSYFGKRHYKELQNLSGDDGAKEVVQNNRSLVQTFAFSGGQKDVDVVSDLKNLE